MGNEISGRVRGGIVQSKKKKASSNHDMPAETASFETLERTCPNNGDHAKVEFSKHSMQESAASFDRQKKTPRSRKEREYDPVMITDVLSDVRKRFHINTDEIGHGHYGVVRKCMDRRTGEWYAIKSIRKSKVNKVEVLKREIDILKEVQHPNIIRLFEVHEDAKYIHLITELCTGGELFDRIIAKTQSKEGHFSERAAASYVRCILDAISYCHDEIHVIHRDLKPENFLLASDSESAPIKIIDFGLSRYDVAPGKMMRTKVGTPYYVAPEVLNRKYDKSCDMWSIGVITYILLCGYPPFYGDSDSQIFDSVRAGKFDFPSPEWDTISNSAKQFVCSLLKINPTGRLTAKEAMQHRWILQLTSGDNNTNSTVRHSKRRSQVFKSYMGMKKLKKAALGHIANQLTQAEIQRLGQVFKSIDQDDAGSMTLKELDAALTSDIFSPDLLQRLRNLREDLSLTGDERINWKDFYDAMMDKSLLMKEDKVGLAFELFRNKEDHRLKVEELIYVLGGENATQEIINLDDLKKGDQISYEEFRTKMTGSFTEIDIDLE